MASDTPPSTDEIAAFVAVAERGSFTAAAVAAGLTTSRVGKAVQRLERRLGVRLLQRSTRVVRLTEDGALYFEAARAALDGLAEAERALSARRGEAAGRLRVDMAVGLGHFILPTLAAFYARHPKVTVDLVLSDRFTDAVAESFDVVVRIGQTEDTALTARKLCDLRPTLCAAPAYLERRGAPRNAIELRDHDAIVFRGPDGRLRPWTLRLVGEEPTLISPTPTLVLSDGQAMVEAAVAGLGIAQIYDKVVASAFAAGTLEKVMPETVPDGLPVHALLPAGRAVSAKTRAFVEHLVGVFSSPVR